MKFNFNSSLLNQFATMFNDPKAALAEFVANSYDAKATEVNIILNYNEGYIEIIDNGFGMNETEFENNFLNIGFNKRDLPQYKEGADERKILGRKSNGRFGVFGFAKTLNIHSLKNKDIQINYTIDFVEASENREDEGQENILTGINDLPRKEIILNKEVISNGTLFKICDIYGAGLQGKFENFEDLVNYMTVHFNRLIKPNKFEIKLIKINGDEITIKEIERQDIIYKKLDRFISLHNDDNAKYKKIIEDIIVEIKDNDLPKEIGEFENINSDEEKENRIIKLSDKFVVDYNKGKQNKISMPNIECNFMLQKSRDMEMQERNIGGWIGTLYTIKKKPKNNDKGDEVANNFGLRIYSRGRLIINNALSLGSTIKTNRFYDTYVVGEIDADFLDEDKYIDIINISRNAIIGPDERMEKLSEYVKSLVLMLINKKDTKSKTNKKAKQEREKEIIKNIDLKVKNIIPEGKKQRELTTMLGKELGIKFPPIHKDRKNIFVSYKDYMEISSDEIIKKYTSEFQKLDGNESKKFINEKKIIENFSYFGTFALSKIFTFLNLKKKYNIYILISNFPGFEIPQSKNIYDYIGLNYLSYYCKNSAIINMLSDKYFDNWNTDIEFGAAWITEKNYFPYAYDYSKPNNFKDPLSMISGVKLEFLFIKSDDETTWESAALLRNNLYNMLESINVSEDELNEFKKDLDSIKFKNFLCGELKKSLKNEMVKKNSLKHAHKELI